MILFGASGHCKVILDIILANGNKVDMILDDNPKKNEIFGVSVVKNTFSELNDNAIIAVGNNRTRKKISEKYKFKYITAFHPESIISQFAKLNEGTVVMAGAIVNPDAEIGRHCIINSGAVIEHDCIIKDFVHISPNVSLAGNVFIDEGVHVGIGASIIQGVKVGKWAVIGAGSVIIKDVPDFATVVGNPGKVIKIDKDIKND